MNDLLLLLIFASSVGLGILATRFSYKHLPHDNHTRKSKVAQMVGMFVVLAVLIVWVLLMPLFKISS